MNGIQIEEKLKEELYRELKITVHKEVLQNAFDKRLMEVQPQVKMKGFRSGKVPIKLIAEVHGKKIWDEFIGGFLNNTNSYAIDKNKIKVAGNSQVKMQYCSLEKGMEYLLCTNLMPMIDLVDLSKLPLLDKPVIKEKVSEGEIEEKLKSLCERHKRINPIKGKRAIKEGDIIVVDLEVKTHGDGKTVVKPTKNSVLELTKELELLPTFNSHLMGKKIGKHEFTIQLPKSYTHNMELAGKKVDCSLDVKEIREAYQYEPDDLLAQKLKFDSLTDLKKALIPEIERDREERSETILRRNAIFALWKTQSIKAPARMVKEEMQHIEEDSIGEDLGSSQKEVSEYRVQTGLLLKDFAMRYGVRVGREELNQAIQKNKQFQQIPADHVATWIFEQKALQALISQCKVKEIEVSPSQFKKIEDQDLKFLKSAKSSPEKPKKKGSISGKSKQKDGK